MKTPLTWREYVRQCDLNDASRRRLEQTVQHGVLYAAALAWIFWPVIQKIL